MSKPAISLMDKDAIMKELEEMPDDFIIVIAFSGGTRGGVRIHQPNEVPTVAVSSLCMLLESVRDLMKGLYSKALGVPTND